MIHEIGKTAGEIWHLLKENGEMPPTKIKKSLGCADNLLYMALGWLAREDQLVFTVDGRTTKVSLKKA